MFIYSFKATKKKIALILFALVAATAALIMFLMPNSTDADKTAVSYKAEDAAQRIAFLSQFGWKISEDPIEVSEVIIPSEFDKAYLQYNEMHKAQGLDLEPYKGMRAKRWTYDILNYPGYEGKSGYVQANLLVYEGRVIGGDICSLEQNGFMQGFDFPAAEQSTQAVSVSQ